MGERLKLNQSDREELARLGQKAKELLEKQRILEETGEVDPIEKEEQLSNDRKHLGILKERMGVLVAMAPLLHREMEVNSYNYHITLRKWVEAQQRVDRHIRYAEDIDERIRFMKQYVEFMESFHKEITGKDDSSLGETYKIAIAVHLESARDRTMDMLTSRGVWNFRRQKFQEELGKYELELNNLEERFAQKDR